MSSDQTMDADRLAGHGWRDSPRVELTPILAAALDAFNEAGYHGTTVRDIARRVGVTVPALYYHYENKEAILFALQESSIQRLNDLCKAALTDAEGDPGEQFLNLVECLVLYMANSTKLAGLDAEIRSLNRDNLASYRRMRSRIEKMLLDTIRQAADAGVFEVTSPKDTARALLGMFQAVATWYRPGRGQLSPQMLARRYVDIAAHAVGASPELIQRVRAADK